MTKEELEMRTLVRESDVIDKTDGSELAKAFNYLWEKYIEQEPSNDMVSRGVFEQILWERDTAIQQLKELGYGLGEKPKTGHWVYDYTAADGHRTYHCSECGCFLKPKHSEPLNSFKWCSLCGAKMIESQESEVSDESSD